MFSHGSSSSTSFAIVTPSFVIVGAPHFLSRTTLWPFGPSVSATASASLFTPASSERRASSLNFSNLLAMRLLLLLGTERGPGVSREPPSHDRSRSLLLLRHRKDIAGGQDQ